MYIQLTFVSIRSVGSLFRGLCNAKIIILKRKRRQNITKEKEKTKTTTTIKKTQEVSVM